MPDPDSKPDITVRGRTINVPPSTIRTHPAPHQPDTPQRKIPSATKPKTKRKSKTASKEPTAEPTANPESENHGSVTTSKEN